jgi:hypothetical protein
MFGFLLVLVHSAGLRWLSYHGLGLDYPWYFQGGVASQYLLGAMFQPSVFGVLLMAGISFFLRDRLVLASLCIAAAAMMHNTYLLPGAMLTGGIVVQLAWEKRYRAGLLMGSMTLALVLPTVVYSLTTFGPTTPEQFARSQDILVHDRIPHHCIVARWLDVPATLQILWVLAALALLWKTRLFAVLAVCAVLSTLLTVVQVAMDSDLLALLFPWRISTVLVPLATTVILGRLVVMWPFVALRGCFNTEHEAQASVEEPPLTQGQPRNYARGESLACAACSVLKQFLNREWIVSVVGLVVLAVAGVGISVGRLAFPIQAADVPLMHFVRDNKKKGDVYLLPVNAPKRASASTAMIRALNGDFKPTDTQKDNRLIPLDLQQFRLGTEAPIFVDFKSIPYKDVEVIEWHDRLLLAEKVQELLKKGEVSQALAELSGRHVTHIVQQADGKVLSDPRLLLIYPTANIEDPRYRVYEIRRTE